MRMIQHASLSTAAAQAQKPSGGVGGGLSPARLISVRRGAWGRGPYPKPQALNQIIIDNARLNIFFVGIHFHQHKTQHKIIMKLYATGWHAITQTTT